MVNHLRFGIKVLPVDFLMINLYARHRYEKGKGPQPVILTNNIHIKRLGAFIQVCVDKS